MRTTPLQADPAPTHLRPRHERGRTGGHGPPHRLLAAAGRTRDGARLRPVSDPAGAWGLAVVEAETITEVRVLADDDPAVVSGLARFEICPIPGAIVAHAPATA
jgi:hypothetical protein